MSKGRKYNSRHILTLLAFILLCRCAVGGLMHMMMMKKMMDKHHHHEDHGGKSIGITFKPIAIPIPLPIAYVEKESMKAQKPWPEESKSKGMMWKMMKMKMKMKMMMMKKMKKMMKGSKAKGCCPMMMPQMKAAWPMMMPTMCPQMMMNGCGMMNACMMKAGWPMKGKAADCPEPEEEEEIEEDWPDYYEEEMMEDQYAWDTKAVPVYKLPDDKKKSKMQKKGDDLDEKKTKDVIVWVKVKDSEIVGPRNKFDYDFDYISL
ncbi:uncharacterized protein LOC129966248 [Argiope bruennichi]|uniref:uncharacterized protein LOC129966248 n=1 Tax=Argiope bruennichi TaxID=94029 RepID=UPI00249451A7|nr:uncharacterized protein LOC129966248 [Argiope bruennichi]